MKITALEESADFATLDTEKLCSKLKSHELSGKGHPNHYASHTSKAFITSAQSSLRCLLSQTSSKLWMWHRRLGHLSFNLLC
jgi:hypothetical protein